MIPEDLLQRLAFDGGEGQLGLRILVGVVAFLVLLRRDMFQESAARMASAVAVGVLAVAALPIVDPSKHIAHAVGVMGVCMVAAAIPLWIELASGAAMMGLASAAVVLHVVADLARMGNVTSGMSWLGIVLVGGAAGAVLFSRLPSVMTAFAASGAAAWSLGFGSQPLAIGVAFVLGMAVSDLPRLTRRTLGKETSYEVGR